MGYLSDQVRAALDGDPDELAVQFKGVWRTWGELARIVRELDAAFARLGIGEGVAVGCVLRNAPEHAALIMGVVSGGRCLVTLNALLPDEKLAGDISAARTPVIVAAAEDWARPAVREAAAGVGAAGIVLSGDPATSVALVAGLEAIGPGPHQTPPVGTAVLMLTSGTTGTPKRVPLKMSVLERQLIEAAGGGNRHGEDQAPPPARGVSIQAGSFVHISGVWGFLGAAMGHRPVVLLEKFNVPEWRAAIVEHRPTAAAGPPAALRMILDADLPREDLASLVAMGAGTAGLDPEIADEFLRRYDLPVITNYGATEFCGAVASWSAKAFRALWTEKRGAVGRVHNSMEARVVDPETDQVLPFGEEGVLELRGFATGQDGVWVRTTDRAVLDADRYLWIRGRADNAIVRGGFKIHPDEVVGVLQQHPAVAEASVVGVPDRRLGQVPVAALVLRRGAARPADGELEALVRSRLLAYCVPTAFKVVDELPRTPSMKVSMPAVRELFETG
jgi:acyl-CoA synthetase (AMP-forming)/AMP-acid ligase II